MKNVTEMRTRLILTAVTILLTAGCSMDERIPDGDKVAEGIPVRISLAYGAQENKVETRASQSVQYENRIENLYLFVFNSAEQRQPLLTDVNGTERTSNIFRFNNGLTPDNGNQSLGSGSVEFVCASLNNATIVAIANVTDGNTSTAYTVTPDELDQIQTLSELKAKVMTMNADAVGRGALFMMTGYAETTDAQGNPTGDTSIDISGNESGTTTLQCALMLHRTDSKVEVYVKAEAANDNWTDFTFTPRTWRVHRVPRQSFILPADNSPVDADGEYFSTAATDFETNEKNVYGFVFYMPENLKAPRKTIEEDDIASAYALREKWITENYTDPAKPGQQVRNIAFEYANDNSTYLEINGELSYTVDGAPVQATTRYYIHLGYGDNDPNDYLTRRNYLYTYNITVKGVNDIILEVTSDQDPRPGHEGDVIESRHSIYDLDSHYDRCLLEILPDDIVTEASTQTTWSVTTPFCSGGVYNPVTGSTKGVEDYRWIKFAINNLHGYQHGSYVKYPGDQEYDPEFVPDENTQNEDLPKLLDIKQLVEYLKIVKKRESDMKSLIPDNSEHICITAFVDEYVYVDDPKTPEVEHNLLLWKEFVNAPDREMHILSSGRQYSQDGNSSYIPSLYTFRQKSIRTMFNPDVANEAWGLESVMETERLDVGNIPASANDPSNGRANMLEWIGDGTLAWTEVLTTSDQYALNTQYNNAMYACVMRNRDLNGNNKIEANEIRWYLASINQLTDMYIGEYALDRDSRLYPWDPASGSYPDGGKVYWHYTSSTAESSNTPVVVWAEEGASKGNFLASRNVNGNSYAYRCVRNLGIDIGDIADPPEDFVSFQKNNDGTYTFNLSKLNPSALRDYYVEGAGTYPTHNEKENDNLPYIKFEVSGKLYPEPNRNWGIWNENDWIFFQTSNPCSGDNYRVPNMRELLIFMSRVGEKLSESWLKMHSTWFYNFYKPHILSFTSFSMKNMPPYQNDGRQGYSHNTDDGSMGPGNNNGYTCGVKDIPQ